MASSFGQFTNYPDGFANGVTVRNIPLLQSNPGKVFWLNNSTALLPGQKGGSDGNRGTYLDPLATLNHAVAVCTAGRGDIIMVGAGHAETITTATQVALATSGVTILGMGSGPLRPTFTFSTVTGSTIAVSANGIAFVNCLFIANFAAVAAPFTLTTATDFALDLCEFRDTSSALNFVSIVKMDTTSNHADRLSITRCLVNSKPTSGALPMVNFTATTDGVLIDGNKVLYQTTNAAALLPIAAGKVLTNMYLTNNFISLQNATGTATGYLITTNGSTNTGFIANNTLHALPTSPLLVTASSGFTYNNNFHADQADTSGYILPAQDS